MNMQPETNSNQINSYKEYLSAFFPELAHTKNNVIVTAEEIGIKMAEETLSHIRNLLAETKTA